MSKILSLEEAISALQDGELVIVPTETVYGLAANALDSSAVAKIFAAKERPTNHPLIVHGHSVHQLKKFVTDWSDVATELSNAFWPGPFTIVMAKNDVIPGEVTAGNSTLAIRVPNHKLFRSLLEQINFPIAAPSANRFTKLSPTRLQDIDPVLLDRCAGVLDGGDCEVGLESTVVRVSDRVVTLLRPGRVSRVEIEAVVGPIQIAESSIGIAPGQHLSHYQPNAKVILVESISPTGTGISFAKPQGPNQLQWPENSTESMTFMYAALHTLDRQNPSVIEVEAPPKTSEWNAIWDRLKRAAFSENS